MTAEQQCLGRFGGGVDHRAAAVLEQSRKFAPELFAQLVIEVRQRLVQQDEVRILDQRAGQRDTLLLASRKFMGPTIQHAGEPQNLRHPSDAAGDLGARQAGHAERRGDVVEHRKILIVDELLVDHGDVALLDRHGGDVAAIQPNLARGRPLQPGHQLNQRGFARQRGAQQDVEAVTLERDAGLVNVNLGADALDDVSELDRHAGAPPAAGMISKGIGIRTEDRKGRGQATSSPGKRSAPPGISRDFGCQASVSSSTARSARRSRWSRPAASRWPTWLSANRAC